MSNLEGKVDLKSWYKKRQYTFYVYALFYFYAGIEIGCIIPTLWIYVTTMLHTQNNGLFYGLINGAYYIPSLFFPPLISRWVDKTRRAKLAITLVNFLAMCGSVLYISSWSPWYPILGRFCTGFVIAVSPVLLSEVVRSYPVQVTANRIMILYTVYELGMVMGPLLTIGFIHVEFWIGHILKNITDVC